MFLQMSGKKSSGKKRVLTMLWGHSKKKLQTMTEKYMQKQFLPGFKADIALFLGKHSQRRNKIALKNALDALKISGEKRKTVLEIFKKMSGHIALVEEKIGQKHFDSGYLDIMQTVLVRELGWRKTCLLGFLLNKPKKN